MIEKMRQIKQAVDQKNASREDCERRIELLQETIKLATRQYSRTLKAILPVHTEIAFKKGDSINTGFVVDYGGKNSICVQTENGNEVWITVSNILSAFDEMEKTDESGK